MNSSERKDEVDEKFFHKDIEKQGLLSTKKIRDMTYKVGSIMYCPRQWLMV